LYLSGEKDETTTPTD